MISAPAAAAAAAAAAFAPPKMLLPLSAAHVVRIEIVMTGHVAYAQRATQKLPYKWITEYGSTGAGVWK